MKALVIFILGVISGMAMFAAINYLFEENPTMLYDIGYDEGYIDGETVMKRKCDQLLSVQREQLEVENKYFRE